MPSLGMVTINALSAADSVIIPVQAQYLPAKGMTQLVQTISRVPAAAIGDWLNIKYDANEVIRAAVQDVEYFAG